MKILCSSCGKLRETRARGLCGGCYNRNWVTGTLPSKEVAYAARWIEKRLLKTKVDEQTGCWVWQGGTDYGYGISCWHSKHEFMHRASFQAHGGVLVKGEQIRHRCANKACWNPAHLLKGTQADNEQDKKDQGRFGYNQGEGRYNSRLTDAKVAEIRRRAGEGETHTALAKEFKYARANLTRLVNRQIWKHVA